MAEFRLPDLGEGVTEAEIDRWLVAEGDEIDEDDPIVEVITDKATAEIPSPFAGVVTRIHVDAGKVVPVGTVLITIDDPAGGVSGARSPEAAQAAVAESATETPAAAGPPPPPPVPGAKSSGAAAPAVGPPRPAAPAPSGPGPQRSAVKAMPPVRKLARELDVDLADVRGSGPGGRITRADVEAHARSRASGDGRAARVAGPPAQPVTGGRREPLRGVRRTIAERMAHAHRVVPPVTHVEECDVTELDAARRLANERAPHAPKLTFLPFIVKAVVAGLRAYPALNASLDEDAGEIVFHERYDVGVATDTPSGLMVPVVRDADKKSLRDIAADIERLATGAKDGKLHPDELRGSTFTVTSPGRFGGLMATPIVFHPQSAILGVHKASQRAVVRDGAIVARLMMNLSITFDHRILDGMTASRFILDVVELLEHPAVLALES
ncbi:MAG TPA: dihydrolipoamide acetyltransferase family protein [Actinomycetota bacterium]|nr:dihydrolipoamide acetyltransferase family protein [Actinomycetota bacterium]